MEKNESIKTPADKKKQLKKLLNPSPSLRFFAWLLLALTLVTPLFAIFAVSRLPMPSPVVFDSRAEDEAYSFIDVQYMNDWFCSYNGKRFYIVWDEQDAPYIAALRSEHLEQLEDIAVYTETGAWQSPFVSPPEPVRIHGYGIRYSSELSDLFADSLGFDDVRSLEEAFGTRMLDATVAPNEDLKYILLTVSIFLFLGTLILGTLAISCSLGCRRSLEYLEAKGAVDEAYDEATSESTLLLQKGRLRLGKRFMFLLQHGQIIEYPMITWCYANISDKDSSVIVKTINGLSFDLARGEESKLLYDELESRNECGSILFGYNLDNQKEYLERVAEYKKLAKAARG